jgi:hypothetical protein
MLIVNFPAAPAGIDAGQKRRIETVKPPQASRTHTGVERSATGALACSGGEPPDTDSGACEWPD